MTTYCICRIYATRLDNVNTELDNVNTEFDFRFGIFESYFDILENRIGYGSQIFPTILDIDSLSCFEYIDRAEKYVTLSRVESNIRILYNHLYKDDNAKNNIKNYWVDYCKRHVSKLNSIFPSIVNNGYYHLDTMDIVNIDVINKIVNHITTCAEKNGFIVKRLYEPFDNMTESDVYNCLSDSNYSYLKQPILLVFIKDYRIDKIIKHITTTNTTDKNLINKIMGNITPPLGVYVKHYILETVTKVNFYDSIFLS